MAGTTLNWSQIAANSCAFTKIICVVVRYYVLMFTLDNNDPSHCYPEHCLNLFSISNTIFNFKQYVVLFLIVVFLLLNLAILKHSCLSVLNSCLRITIVHSNVTYSYNIYRSASLNYIIILIYVLFILMLFKITNFINTLICTIIFNNNNNTIFVIKEIMTPNEVYE